MALGQEENTGAINEPGTYKDPETGKELTVTMPAGADALARLGWELQAPVAEQVEETKTTPKQKTKKGK